MYTIRFNDDHLEHHGILGQKWGIRRYQNPDGSLTSEGKIRYSSEQYKRDRAVYGRSGANRISKHIYEGDSVSEARSREANRINSARNRSTVAGQMGAIVGGVGGAVGGYFASRYIVDKLGLPTGSLESLAAQAVISSGVAQIGKTLGRYGGRSISMLASGYKPSKWRYGN